MLHVTNLNGSAVLAQAAATAKLIPLPPSSIPAVLVPEKIDIDSTTKAKPAKVKKMRPGPKENGQ